MKKQELFVLCPHKNQKTGLCNPIGKPCIEANDRIICQALKKQIPIKPCQNDVDFYCSANGCFINDVYNLSLNGYPQFCEQCGQKIDWSNIIPEVYNV